MVLRQWHPRWPPSCWLPLLSLLRLFLLLLLLLLLLLCLKLLWAVPIAVDDKSLIKRRPRIEIRDLLLDPAHDQPGAKRQHEKSDETKKIHLPRRPCNTHTHTDTVRLIVYRVRVPSLCELNRVVSVSTRDQNNAHTAGFFSACFFFRFERKYPRRRMSHTYPTASSR
eukprot:COSAG06_NODE_2886_length_6133_cov_5.617667_4_plen_168_part_00